MAACSAFTPTLCSIDPLCFKKTSLSVSAKKIVSLSREPYSCRIRAANTQSAQSSQDAEKKEDLEDTRLKVFTDETTGVVCYRTDSGEVVCEGVDEGPTFYPPSGSNFYIPDTRAAAMLPLQGEVMYEI